MNLHIQFTLLLLWIINAIWINTIEAAGCYSCMSAIYEAGFKSLGLRNVYNLPEKFTDQCDDMKNLKDIPVKECASNCVAILETITWGAGGFGHTRGCYDSIMKFGFNKTGTIGRMKFSEMCGTFNFLSTLQQPPAPWQDTKVRFCSCKGHLCNSSWTNTAASLSLLTLSSLAIVFYVLLRQLLPYTFL